MCELALTLALAPILGMIIGIFTGFSFGPIAWLLLDEPEGLEYFIVGFSGLGFLIGFMLVIIARKNKQE